MKRIILITLVILIAAVVQAGQLSKLKKIYETSEQKIEKKAEVDTLTVGQKYIGALKQMKKNCKKKGDVQGIIALNKEIDRFATDKTIQTTGTVHVVKAQKYALPLLERVNTDRLKKKDALLVTYKKALENEKIRLTLADKISEALEVEAELKRIEFVKADVETKIPEQVEVIARPSSKVGWVSKDATYTVSSVHHIFHPKQALLTYEGGMHGENDFAFCTAINSQNPHIIIDLGEEKLIESVYIEGRKGYDKRQKDISIWLSNDKVFDLPNPLWVADKLQQEWTVTLPELEKVRYIRIGVNGTGTLHFKHVKIFGWEPKGSTRRMVKAKSLKGARPIRRLLK